MSAQNVAPKALAGRAPSQGVAGAEEKGPKSELPVAPYIIVGDTDGHGTTLSASIVRALLDLGIPAENIAIHNHFNPKGLSTSARGDLIGYINALADAIAQSGLKPTIFIADIPTPVQAPQEYAEALAKLASVSERIVYIDTAGHGFNHQLPAMLAKKGVKNIQFRLGLSVPQTYLVPALMAPSVQIYDLAVLGTVLDMDVQAIPELNEIRELAEKAEETSLPPLTIETVRVKMHEFVAFDNYLKFGRDWPQPSEPVKLWGNMAQKVAVMATKPIAELYQKAIASAGVPTVEDIKKATKVVGFVAVVEKEAPRGHVFNYAKLAQAGLETPIVLTYSVGFQPGKKVVVLAPNAFEKSTEAYATEAIKRAVQEAFEEFTSMGWSDPQSDFPRGAGALTLGVKEEYLDMAIQKLVEKANKHYIEIDRAKYASEVTKAEMLALVADEKLASTLASIVEKIVRSVVESCRH